MELFFDNFFYIWFNGLKNYTCICIKFEILSKKKKINKNITNAKQA